MSSATNIPISATTTEFQTAFKAAQSVTNRFERDLAKMFASFQQGTGNVRTFQSQIGQATSAIKSAQNAANSQSITSSMLKDFQSFTGQLSTIKNTVSGAFAVEQVLSFGKEVTATTGKFEKYGSVLKNALQSASLSGQSLSQLTDFAADTPYQLDELTGDFIKLVNRGIIPTKQQLTNFGDLAASQGKGFDQLTEAILDAQSGEFERLKEFGIRASKSGDQVTLSFKGMTQTVSNSGQAITGAIQKFGQLTGVAGSMAAVSQTLEGQESNLADTYDRLLVAIGNTGVAGAYKFALSAASSFLNVTRELISNSPAEELRKQKDEINGLVGAIALANDNEALRLSLIQQLKQAYPEFLGNLNDEAVTADVLTRRLASVNEQYERKIRIAIGEDKIKQAQEKVTASIRQQSDALRTLATESGKTVTELEKLTPAQQVDLAKQLAQRKRSSQAENNVFGVRIQTQFDYLPTVLSGAMEAQKKAQTELDQLTKENLTRQADLTNVTVDGYKKEIAQIREKIRLKQGDKAENEAEIKRLQDQIRIAQGKPAPIIKAPVTSTTKTASAAQSGDGTILSLLNRTEADLQKKIQDLTDKEITIQLQGLNENDPKSYYVQLRAVRSELERIQNLTSKTSTEGGFNYNDIKRIGLGTSEMQAPIVPVALGITLPAVAIKNINTQVSSVIANALKAMDSMPSFFAKTRADDFLTDIEKAKPSLDAIKAKIEDIQNQIATVALKKDGIVPPELLKQLKELKQLLADATNATKSADTNTDPGNAEGKDDDAWTKKAQKRIDRMKAAGKEVNFTAQELGAEMKKAAKAFAQTGFDALESIGSALANGADPLQSVLQTLTDALGNYLIKQGEALAMAALFSETAAVAAGPFAPLLAIPVGFQLAAAGVMIAGGAAVKNIGHYAKGSVFNKPTVGLLGEYPNASFDQEIATPQSIMAETFNRVLSSRLSDFRIDPSVGLRGLDNRSGISNALFQQVQGAYANQPQRMVFDHQITIKGGIQASEIKFALDRHEVSRKQFG